MEWQKKRKKDLSPARERSLHQARSYDVSLNKTNIS